MNFQSESVQSNTFYPDVTKGVEKSNEVFAGLRVDINILLI